MHILGFIELSLSTGEGRPERNHRRHGKAAKVKGTHQDSGRPLLFLL